MSKKAEYFEVAEKLFVYEHMTFETIASRLPVSERTLRNWGDEGKWQEKRGWYIQTRKSLHEECFDTARLIAEQIREDLKTEEGVKPGTIYGFANIVKLLDKIKTYENAAEIDEKHKTDGQKTFDTNDLVELMKKEVLGL